MAQWSLKYAFSFQCIYVFQYIFPKMRVNHSNAERLFTLKLLKLAINILPGQCIIGVGLLPGQCIIGVALYANTAFKGACSKIFGKWNSIKLGDMLVLADIGSFVQPIYHPKWKKISNLYLVCKHLQKTMFMLFNVFYK